MKEIEVVPYNPDWPKLFAAEAAKIKQALGNNCVAIHHIGSTSVPYLPAKPIIDMIPVVLDLKQVDLVNDKMQALGYEVKGEHGILFRRHFVKRKPNASFNIHIYENESPEIEHNLKFRDWMRTHAEDRKAYAELKQGLARQFPQDGTSYWLGKDKFIGSINIKAGWQGLRLVKALTPREWAFIGKDPLEDPNQVYLALYQGIEIIGYAHIHFLPENQATIQLSAKVHEDQFLSLIEKWLKSQNFQI